MLRRARDMITANSSGERNQWRSRLVKQIRDLATHARTPFYSKEGPSVAVKISGRLQDFLRNPTMAVCDQPRLVANGFYK